MLELPITALSHAGEGIGRVDGRVIFVPFALPGETVQAELVEDKRKFGRARLVAILAPAAERVTPRCPHHFNLHPPPGFDSVALATACGGCQLQHLAYPAQLVFKQQAVVEQLQRIGAFDQPPVRPALPAPSPFEYRNHVQFALTSSGRLGFRAAGSHRVIAIRECHIIEPALAALYPRIEVEPQEAGELEAVSLRVGASDEALVLFETEAAPPEMSLDMALSAAMLRPDGSTMTLAGGDSVVIEVRDRRFRVSGGSFFQVNTAAAGLLVDLVLDGLALRSGEAVLDLYSGVGLFSAFIAPKAGRVVGVEAYEPAVADAAVNLDDFENVEIYSATVEDALPSISGPFDAAVLDPPRAGCTPAALAALIAAHVARIVYVSCDAATFARDALRLAAAGYRLDWVQPVDLFPQTYHIELVALFLTN